MRGREINFNNLVHCFGNNKVMCVIVVIVELLSYVKFILKSKTK